MPVSTFLLECCKRATPCSQHQQQRLLFTSTEISSPNAEMLLSLHICLTVVIAHLHAQDKKARSMGTQEHAPRLAPT